MSDLFHRHTDLSIQNEAVSIHIVDESIGIQTLSIGTNRIATEQSSGLSRLEFKIISIFQQILFSIDNTSIMLGRKSSLTIFIHRNR